MEYPKKNINGDAGEYLVAYKVTKLFGWPCRLYGVDLGVDAEIEVTDDACKSTGDIIKVQIKSIDSITAKKTYSVYVDDRHIDYWKRFCLPVIICCVDLEREKIYWKQVTATEAYDSGGVSKKVEFCLINDELTTSTKDELKKLVVPEQSKKIDSLFDELDQIAEKLPESSTGYIDYESIYKDENLCKTITEKLREIDDLIAHFPWRVSALALRKLNSIKNHVRVTENNCGYYHSNLIEGS